MYLIVILLASAAMQLWGSRNPLHRDLFYQSWLNMLESRRGIARFEWLQWLIAVLIPVALVALVAERVPLGIWLILATVILLYSFGRGEFAAETTAYTLACNDGAWEVAANKAARQGARVEGLLPDDWSQLHQRMLEATAYQGFERFFAVIFWFLLFGPAGALLYRLSFLYAQSRPERRSLQHWLWALEWLPVRVVGASFAVTGNFVGCMNRWKAQVFSMVSSSAAVLRETVLGALSVDDELMLSCDCTQREVFALKRLYTRTVWFWLTCIAIWVLLQA